jgi:DNA-binding transcriptional ArsR family regulator
MKCDPDKIRQLFEASLPLFNALGDPVRQRLIMLMMDGERKSVAELAIQTHLSRPTVSHHLKILKDADIITDTKEGTRTYYYPHMGEHFESVKALITAVAEIEEGERKGE